jgi:aspartate/methionine/tyrosine aminotransferase
MTLILNKAENSINLSKRVQNLQLPIFREIAALAKRQNAIDLGGGTPDFSAPEELKAAAVLAIQSDYNQYALSQGVQELREGISERLISKARR